MGTVTLDQVLELAKQLTAEEQVVLKARLPLVEPGPATANRAQSNRFLKEIDARRTAELRASLDRRVAELKALRESGADFGEPLMGKYRRPDRTDVDLSFEAIEADIRDASNKWKEDFDDLDDEP